MKFNYDLYRPKKIIQDAWKANSAYFRAKDIRVTPLTKIGDADEVYKSQSTGRIPALAQRFKRKRLTLSEVLPRRKKITIQSAGHQKKVEVRVNTHVGIPTKLVHRSPQAEQFSARVINLSRELTATLRRNWADRRTALSQLGLAMLIIGAGAGSVHAYINHSHPAHTEPSSQTSTQATTQPEAPKTEKSVTETPPPPEPSADSTPDPRPATPASVPAINDKSNNHLAPSSSSAVTTHDNPEPAPPAPALPEQDTSNAPPPVATPPTTPDSSTTPPSQPQPSTPPSDQTDTTQTSNETNQTTISGISTNTSEQTTTSSPADSKNISAPIKENKSSDQKSTKQ